MDLFEPETSSDEDEDEVQVIEPSQQTVVSSLSSPDLELVSIDGKLRPKFTEKVAVQSALGLKRAASSSVATPAYIMNKQPPASEQEPENRTSWCWDHVYKFSDGPITTSAHGKVVAYQHICLVCLKEGKTIKKCWFPAIRVNHPMQN